MLKFPGLWHPRSITADGKRLLVTRALRGLADSAVSVLLPSYLTAIGFTSLRVGAIVFGTLIGRRYSARRRSGGKTS